MSNPSSQYCLEISAINERSDELLKRKKKKKWINAWKLEFRFTDLASRKLIPERLHAKLQTTIAICNLISFSTWKLKLKNSKIKRLLWLSMSSDMNQGLGHEILARKLRTLSSCHDLDSELNSHLSNNFYERVE